jgi:hypothetical protein
MGAWGHGILQNDSAQDGLCEVGEQIEGDVTELAEKDGPDVAHTLLGALGLLTQFNPYSFDPDNEFSEVLKRALTRHRPAMGTLDEATEKLIDDLLADREPTYEMMTPPAELQAALHGSGESDMPMEKTWARAPAGCFAHAASRAYVQRVADRCVETVDADFARPESLEEPFREAIAMGEFGLLLILDPIHVDAENFTKWRAAWRARRLEADPSEADFVARYDAALECAFDYAITRFAGS